MRLDLGLDKYGSMSRRPAFFNSEERSATYSSHIWLSCECEQTSELLCTAAESTKSTTDEQMERLRLRPVGWENPAPRSFPTLEAIIYTDKNIITTQPTITPSHSMRIYDERPRTNEKVQYLLGWFQDA